jgi:hypothetical protein
MDVRLALLLFFLISCMPTAQVSRGNISNSAGTDTTTTTTIPTSTTGWNYLSALSTSITLNGSNLNSAYLVGSAIETYLATAANFSAANYCLVGSYSLGGVAYELRSNIVPISYYDFTAKRTVRILRVDFPETATSSVNCAGALKVLNSSGVYVTDSTGASSPAYDPKLVCSNCTSGLTSTKVRLFKKDGVLSEVPTTLISLSSLILRIDPNNTTTGNSTCTNSACVASGYNCCLDNQCVSNGAVRPSASTLYSSQLAVAEQERLQNPLAYLNYPQLYYICGTSGTTTGTTTGGGTTYDAAFELLKKDYTCIQNIKAQSTLTPFQTEIFTRTTPYTAATDCLTAAGDANATMYYQTVLTRLYQTCGCSQTGLLNMINNCPAYEYTITSANTLGQPTQIDCYTPPSATPTIPLQQTVNLNSRSAPHRFFDSAGTERVLSSGATGFTQEGEVFQYLDDSKVVPDQKAYSMNAILGQMSVSLDQALPAKTIAVNLDSVYLISTVSGTYTPCPTCGKDSWISSFSATPLTYSGAGLEAVSYTTARDEYAGNSTLGNYEDTIFGRACWLPPTMIPNTHSAYSSVATQRQNRLKSQAALFTNGYQRDWFGFNKGALIGSFDGVSWFAIGKGRIVKSTTKKLFLAINAPFADLASPNIHVVNVQAYDGTSVAPQVDYDPAYHQYDSLQNEAGNCQKYHMCATDTDCVTKLGWEYACSDVKDLTTQWPTFDIDGNEIANSAVTKTIDQILVQKKFPSSNTKRCVYRGAGSLCHRSITTLSDVTKRKNLMCAPNFYCASVSQADFSNSVARYAGALSDVPAARNHLFGQDANVLGRPLNYTGSASTLPSVTSATLMENLSTYESTGAAMAGVCRPGKALPDAATEATLSNPFTQHASLDSLKRTDFISQIASCNSSLFTNNRHTSCPVLGTDGNYELFASTTFPTDYANKAKVQNACGLESLQSGVALSSTADTLSLSSPFRQVEAKTLSSQIILDKTLARDACLRRAGQVCHTDLDCSPNKLHASQVDIFAASYFGNAAEKAYHTQYLVCGQTDAKPLPTDTNYETYDMSLNRCCREIGSDLSTYTPDTATTTTGTVYDVATAGLKTVFVPGALSSNANQFSPNDDKRYSRFVNVENLNTSTRPILSAYTGRNASTGALLTSTQGGNVMTPKQWMTLSETNSETCCGGGWIRKFADGTTDWTKTDRFYVDVSNFACVNSRTTLLTHPSDVASQYSSSPIVLVNQDFGDYCKDGTNTKGSCAQYSISDSLTDTGPASNPYSSSVIINTASPNYSSTNLDNFFNPRSSDTDSLTYIDFSVTTGRQNVSIKIPSFVTQASFDSNGSRVVQMTTDTGSPTITCSYIAGTSPISTSTAGAGTCTSGGCCYWFNTTTRVLNASVDSAYTGFASKRAGVKITVPAAGSGLIGRTKPGTNSYYLRRFGKFELAGIPQISFEPMMCNDNSSRVIPGLYTNGIASATDFASNAFSFISSGTRYTSTSGLANGAIFSANDFKCCTPLGKTTATPNRCCSGHGTIVTGSTTNYTCDLPVKTDLMVYFNRLVSNEGRGSDQPGGGLLDADFDTVTGEPLLTTTINQKIADLGVAYCSSKKIRQGGAFGSFEPEPQGSDTNLSSRIYNLVDSSRDNGQNSSSGGTINTGYTAFMDGFRWNHHLYCDN